MAIREVDAISNAIIETEREIAGDAWDVEDTERDEGGDRSLESMGEGLEGQQEAEDDDEADGDAEGDEGSEDDGEADEDEGEAEAAAAAAKAGEGTAPKPGEGQQQRTEGRVPSGKLREANERARLLQAELDALKADKGPAGELKALSEQLAAATRRIDDLSRGQTRQPPPAQEKQEPKEAPDIFEDPKAFVAHITEGFQTVINSWQTSGWKTRSPSRTRSTRTRSRRPSRGSTGSIRETPTTAQRSSASIPRPTRARHW